VEYVVREYAMSGSESGDFDRPMRRLVASPGSAVGLVGAAVRVWRLMMVVASEVLAVGFVASEVLAVGFVGAAVRDWLRCIWVGGG
jgi:hypothetical protein